MGGEHAWKYPVMFELAPACGGGWSGGRGVLSTAVAIATAGGWCQTAASVYRPVLVQNTEYLLNTEYTPSHTAAARTGRKIVKPQSPGSEWKHIVTIYCHGSKAAALLCRRNHLNLLNVSCHLRRKHYNVLSSQENKL